MRSPLLTMCDLLADLQELNWCPDSIEEVRQKAEHTDILLLRGKYHVESFVIKQGMPLNRAATMIRGHKGNSRVRLYVTLRANSRI